MIERICYEPEIYRIQIELKENTLKNLNSYVLISEGESLVIDTGFHTPDCQENLFKALKILNISLSETSLFLTHLHADHIGLAELFTGEKNKIYMGQTDYDYLTYIKTGSYWEDIDALYLKEGFPEEELNKQKKENPGRVKGTKGMFPAHCMKDKETFQIGSVVLECVEVPGHTPGHICLYIRDGQIMFLGDHVLYDISPNVMAWPKTEDSLGQYLNSLNKIKEYKVRLALPAHRDGNEKSLSKRADEIIAHHERRLEEIVSIIKESKKGGITAYEIAAHMKWALHGSKWDNAPAQQKWFALGEIRAHLVHLEKKNQICRYEKDGIFYYCVACIC